MNPIRGVIKITEFPSVNSMYISRGRGRKVPSEALTNFKEEVLSYLSISKIKDRKVPYITLELTLGFYLKAKFWKRDADNMIKAATDAIASYFEFNDSWIVDWHIYKRSVENLEGDAEYLFFELKEWGGDYESLFVKKGEISG